MAQGRLSDLRQYFRRILGAAGDEQSADGQLLERYVKEGDEAAFAALVQRYGSLVFGVCKRVLQDPHDAEDAFQATFLVLVRKAPTLDRSGPIGNWIYTVAYRTAAKARANAARRRNFEKRALPMPADQTIDYAILQELRPVLDQEINRLPEKYRAPLVLCYLQGKTNEQAAHELGWPSGSMSRRLAQGRKLLHKALVGRGFMLPALSGTVLGTLLTSEASASAVPGSLAATTVKAAMLFNAKTVVGTAALSPSAAALAEETLRALVIPKLKVVSLVLLKLVLPLGLMTFGAAVTWEVLPALRNSAYDPGSHAWQHTACQKVWEHDTTLYGRTTPVAVLAAAPDGVTIASGGERPDPTIQLLDLPSRRVRDNGVLAGHEDTVTALAFSPDGRLLASGSQDQSIRLWDLTRSDYPSAVLRGHDKGVTSVAFVPPGSNLLVSAGLDGTIKLWDVATSRCVKTLPADAGPVACLAVSPEGKILASGGFDGTVHLWDLSGGKVPRTLSGHRDKVSSICFSPNGKLLASASWDRTIRTWEIASGQPRVLEGHEGPVSCLQSRAPAIGGGALRQHHGGLANGDARARNALGSYFRQARRPGEKLLENSCQRARLVDRISTTQAN
jgi:RNA polymerase sigma factor (sigma-70 family)